MPTLGARCATAARPIPKIPRAVRDLDDTEIAPLSKITRAVRGLDDGRPRLRSARKRRLRMRRAIGFIARVFTGAACARYT